MTTADGTCLSCDREADEHVCYFTKQERARREREDAAPTRGATP